MAIATEVILPPVAAGRPLQPMAVIRRRSGPMLIAFATALLLAILVASMWPASYVSTGTILIEQQEVPVDLVRSTISSYADQRLQVINQRVMTTDNLLRIIQRYDLYAGERRKSGRETIIGLIRDDIQFRTISADVIDPRQGRPVQATIAFSLGYRSRSPDVAARVANELSSLYLQENLDSRKQLTEQATSFLSEEADKLSKHISEIESQMESFKLQHVNNLPDQAQLNVQFMSRADDEKRSVETQLHSLDQQILYLDAQLAQVGRASPIYTSSGQRVVSPTDRLKILRSDYAHANGVYAPDHPDVLRLKREIEGLEQSTGAVETENDRVRSLHDAESQLAAARQRYAADHPDVVRLERLVASLTAATDSSVVVPAVASATTRQAAEAADNPAYIQLQTQRQQAGSARDALQRERAGIMAKLAELERRLETSPGVEREYATLIRELDGTQLKYREVRQKQMEAQLAQSLEVERKGERFTLIEPPLPPEEPTSPNRRMILVLGLVLAVAAALCIAFLLESLDDSIRGRAELSSLLTAPPLAVIPWFETETDRASSRSVRLKVGVAVAAILVIALPLTHFFYRPLDVLWAVAMRRFGL